MPVLNRAAYGHGFPTQGGVQHHLDAGVKAVHITVQDRSLLHTASPPTASCGTYHSSLKTIIQGRICRVLREFILDMSVFPLYNLAITRKDGAL